MRAEGHCDRYHLVSSAVLIRILYSPLKYSISFSCDPFVTCMGEGVLFHLEVIVLEIIWARHILSVTHVVVQLHK